MTPKAMEIGASDIRCASHCLAPPAGSTPPAPISSVPRRPPLTFTSGIVSMLGACTIALFLTGWKHAGENLAEVLKQRACELPGPIQMSDALPQYRERLISGRNLFVWNFLGIANAVLKAAASNFPSLVRANSSCRETRISFVPALIGRPGDSARARRAFLLGGPPESTCGLWGHGPGIHYDSSGNTSARNLKCANWKPLRIFEWKEHACAA
jgi:hypothetical protein